MKTSVVILNWNGLKFLQQFLPGVVGYSSDCAEVIVADNASTDGSVDWLKQMHPEVRVIENESNGGFAKGYNDALKQVDSEYYILLNSDIEVTPGWIEPIIKMMDADKNIGACQPKILSWHHKTHFEYAGAAGGYIDSFGYPFCRGRIFFNLEEDKGQYNDVAEIFWATGACLFIRSEVYHALGGFDEDFFAHMEEIDLCWRMKHLGYKVMFCPGSSIYHIGGGTLPKSSARKTYLNFRNNFTLLYKNLPTRRLIPVFGLRFILDGVAALKFLIDGGFRDFWAVVRAHFSFYRSMGKNIRKRKSIIRKDASAVYRRSIVMDHYLRGKKSFSQLARNRFS